MPERLRGPHVIIIDDDIEMAEMLADGLSGEGFHGAAVTSGQEAVARIEAGPVDALITDLHMPGMDGIELLTVARRVVPGLPVIVMTGDGALETAIESIRRGAYHYLTKPFKLEELVVVLRRALDKGRVRGKTRPVRDNTANAGIVAHSATIRGVLDVLARLARIDAPVLLTGPTGTGKGLLARCLHAQSNRARGPFVTIDCATLPEPLLESELFGNGNKGASAGSPARSADLFAKARGGTLFIDEIGEMAPALQAKLLDVLERREIPPAGSAKEKLGSVRIVTATHRDIRRLVAEGLFREDLLNRLDLAHVLVPPLRDRREDIPELAERFLAEARQRHPFSRVKRLSRACVLEMIAYPWPGNARELAHAVERMVMLGRSEEAQFSDALAPRTHSKEVWS